MDVYPEGRRKEEEGRMCGRFIIVPQDVLDGIIREIEVDRVPNPMPDWPAQRQSAYPGAQAPVVTAVGGFWKTEPMTWGFEAPWSKGLVFNTRVETAVRPGRNMWADALAQRRCVVASFGFFEPHRTQTARSAHTGATVRQQYLFTRPAAPLLFMGGLFEDGRLSVMTTEPNAAVAPVHDRMPLVLEPHELATWLAGDFTTLFDRSAIALCAEKEAAGPPRLF